MTYTYPKISGDIVVMALKIEKQIALPDGMTTNENQIGVIFNTPLTDPQKATLDAIMSDVNIGTIPSTGNTVYTLDDIMDLRSQLKTTLAASGISFDIFPSGKSQYKLIFNKVLSNADKTTLRNAVLGFLKQIQ